MENCFLNICLEPINLEAGKFFGFSEYLASLAIMVLAWNIVDVRYKFRLYVAPLNLQKSSFYVMSLIGFFCLMMEFWLLKGFPVLKDSYVTFEDLQFILAFTYLSVFILWIRFAFIKPSRFGRRNAKKYVDFIGNVFITKNINSVSIILDEISNSVNEIVEIASEKSKDKLKIEEKCANTIIALISEKFICEVMVDKHPMLFNEIFKFAYEKEKFNMDLGLISINFITSAIENSESFIYRENDEFLSGYLSAFKPVCSGIYDNYKIVSSYDSLLIPDINTTSQDYNKWRAYFFLLDMSIKSYLDHNHLDITSSFLHWPKIKIRSIGEALRYIDSKEILDRNHNSFKIVKELSNFFDSTSENLGNSTVSENNKGYIYDFISCLLFEVITDASRIKSSLIVRKFIQKRLVWDELYCTCGFIHDQENIVIRNVNELIYNKIREIEQNPSVDAVEMLVYILLVLGLEPVNEGEYGKAWRILHIQVLGWCEENLSGILDKYPRIISEYFPENITYNADVPELSYSYGDQYEPVLFKLAKGDQEQT